jgi:predicted RND superfamily exporter protein
VKITLLLFFVGGVSAIASLGMVWWTKGTVDAIMMSMPSLVYVLGLSGAVHITNYYRDAVQEKGLPGAPERALAHGWKPCALAALTTALGLMSLNTSNLVPIRRFGFYSALGVMATLILLFTFLPSALQMWPPGYEKRRSAKDATASFGLQDHLIRFWEPIGRWIVRRYVWVTLGCTAAFLVFALGLPRINTSVHLIKLFDEDARIIHDYAWLEDHLGKLVPMELVVRVRPERMRNATDEEDVEDADYAEREERLRLNFLERVEIAARIQQVVESTFGEHGQGVVGHGMSVPTFAPDLPPPGISTLRDPTRGVMNRQLESHRGEYLASDYLRIDREGENRGSELWRISLRLGALLDVDYGRFVNELQRVVEPVLTAYRCREQILDRLEEHGDESGVVKARVAFLGLPDPDATDRGAEGSEDAGDPPGDARPAYGSLVPGESRAGGTSVAIDQTRIFAETVRDLMTSAGVYAKRGCWHDPDAVEAPAAFYTSDDWAKLLATKFDCVVLVRDHEDYDLDFIRQHAAAFVDARDHGFDPATPEATAAVERGDPIHVVYTGLVPIVYKAQRTLLTSLVDSIGAAFLMIALVMMLLLRNGPLGPFNFLNARAGLVSMIPNVFPVVLIYGALGFLNIRVDIGMMMTASVAMGVAVDDTIHFLTWFRQGIAAGLDRGEAIVQAYKRCAAAMTQTTLIGGFGLAVFAFSTFTPTQCFGVMMLTLLAAALVGDLVFLPALLAGPLGKYFCPPAPRVADAVGGARLPGTEGSERSAGTPSGALSETPFAGQHSGETESRRDRAALRRDSGHQPFSR